MTMGNSSEKDIDFLEAKINASEKVLMHSVEFICCIGTG
jgi:hypothetical protein